MSRARPRLTNADVNNAISRAVQAAARAHVVGGGVTSDVAVDVWRRLRRVLAERGVEFDVMHRVAAAAGLLVAASLQAPAGDEDHDAVAVLAAVQGATVLRSKINAAHDEVRRLYEVECAAHRAASRST